MLLSTDCVLGASQQDPRGARPCRSWAPAQPADALRGFALGPLAHDPVGPTSPAQLLAQSSHLMSTVDEFVN